MINDCGPFRVHKKQAGLSLVLVVFVLVALSVLAAALVQLLTVNSIAVANEVLSARAFLAAESGAQRLLNEIHLGSETDCASAAGVVENHSYTFSQLVGCESVEVACSYVQLPVTSGDIYYTLESFGRCGPVGQEASRAIEVQAKNI